MIYINHSWTEKSQLVNSNRFLTDKRMTNNYEHILDKYVIT